MAADLHAAAAAARLNVPVQVSIVGVDNELNAHFDTLGISSVVLPLRQIGYQAAEILDGCINGDMPSQLITRLLPVEIVTRASCDARALDDDEVLSAFKLIQSRAWEKLEVVDLLAEVALSRRTLERRYRKAFGISPKGEILRVRVMRACKLLATSSTTVAEVASACGFGDRVQFNVQFNKLMGMSPTQYRRMNQRLK